MSLESAPMTQLKNILTKAINFSRLYKSYNIPYLTRTFSKANTEKCSPCMLQVYLLILTVKPEEVVNFVNVGGDEELFKHHQGIHVEFATGSSRTSHRPPNSKVWLSCIDEKTADGLNISTARHCLCILVQD